MPIKTDLPRGEHYDPFGVHLTDPYPFYAQARAEHPVFYSTAFQAWVVTRYDDVRHVLINSELFSSVNAVRPMTALTPECLAELNRGYLPTSYLINTDGADHQRLRAPFIKFLDLRRVRKLVPFVRVQADALIDAMLPEGSAEFMHQFAYPFPFRITAQLFGLDESDFQLAQDSSYASARLYRKGILLPSEQLAHARDIVRFQHLLARYINARRAEPRDDLISAVVAALAPGNAPLTEDQERDLVWGLAGISGGERSVTSSLGMGLYYLLANRDRWKMLVAKPSLIGNAVEEICRYEAPAQTFRRLTVQPVTIGGVDLPAGTDVLVILGAANRDDTLVDRPEEFDITRPRMRHLTFGQGPHVCAGASLGRVQLRTALEALTRRIPDLRLSDEHDVRIEPVVNHRKPIELHVTWRS